MRLPQYVFSFGDGPEAAALRELFGLFIPKSFCYQPDTFEEKYLKKMLIPCEESLIVIISTAQGEDIVSYLITCLVLLRFKIQWKGAILLITEPANVTEVQKWDLFKLQDGSAYVGQACIARPVVVGELMYTLSTLRPYASGAWRLMNDALKSRGEIQRAWNLFNEIEDKVFSNKWPADSLKQLFQILMDEKLVLKNLIGHDGFNTIREFADIHENLSNPNKEFEEYSMEENKKAVISSLRDIMGRIPHWSS